MNSERVDAKEGIDITKRVIPQLITKALFQTRHHYGLWSVCEFLGDSITVVAFGRCTGGNVLRVSIIGLLYHCVMLRCRKLC